MAASVSKSELLGSNIVYSFSLAYTRNGLLFVAAQYNDICRAASIFGSLTDCVLKP